MPRRGNSTHGELYFYLVAALFTAFLPLVAAVFTSFMYR
jgi:hypothetical protein